tara:strand:- start:98 stop:442 length:345 start_codon:yes stop_codon:yes gene_type:complete
MKKFKKICFDIDGVICKTKNNNYKGSKPLRKSINLINKLFDEGHTIIIFTARFMGRNKDRINLAKKQGFQMTKKQLQNWNVKYHKLIFGKPSFDLIIDDKSYNFKKNWVTKINI